MGGMAPEWTLWKVAGLCRAEAANPKSKPKAIVGLGQQVSSDGLETAYLVSNVSKPPSSLSGRGETHGYPEAAGSISPKFFCKKVGIKHKERGGEK